MSARILLGLAIVGLLLGSNPLSAHHGGAVEYEMARIVGPIVGTVRKFELTYPHPLLYFDVKTPDGKVEEWAVLVRPTPAILRKHGWTRTIMKPGDTVSITMHPHRSVPRMGNSKQLIVNGKVISEDVTGMTDDNAPARAAANAR